MTEMSRQHVVYRQRFETTPPVTDSLNNFLRQPKNGFDALSKAHTELEGDLHDIRVAMSPVDRYSRSLGRVGVYLGEQASIQQLPDNGLRLLFSPHDPARYLSLIQRFGSPVIPANTPPEELERLLVGNLFIDLPGVLLKEDVRERSLAARALAHTLRDTNTRHGMVVRKVEGISEKILPPKAATTAALDVV
jgi:hypothetical protein